MPDYGHELLFGVFLPPVAQQADAVLALATHADEAELDLVSVQDHPYNPQFLDAWTLLTTIAATTSRVRVFPNVANLPLRPPAMLARQVAALDILSGGRAELGLGAGAFWDAIEAMGGPRRSPGESVDALREAIGVIRALWTPGRGARLAGEHYSLHGVKPGPFPAHDVGIWVGAYKERMLRLTGELADGWLPSSSYAPPEQLAEMNAIIDGAATDAGRSPRAVRRLYNISGSFAGGGADFLQGPPKVWAEQLTGLALDEGISGFVLAVNDTQTIDQFAAEVAPAVRELVAAERGGSVSLATVDEPSTARATLAVEPTPDSGVRLSAERLWDESERPHGPKPAADAEYTAGGQALARDLIAVHNHLRGELSQVRDMIGQVATGDLDPGAARSEIAKLTMRQNQWTVGAYCESYCRLVGMHHTLESQAMFPRLRSLDGRLAPVVDRLHAEHLVIAGVLERVDAALVTLVASPATGMSDLRSAVDLLTDTLLSHLSYEEGELVEPLGRLGQAVYGSLLRALLEGPGTFRRDADGDAVLVVPVLTVAHAADRVEVLVQQAGERRRRRGAFEHLGATGNRRHVPAARRAVEVQGDLVVGSDMPKLRRVWLGEGGYVRAIPDEPDWTRGGPPEGRHRCQPDDLIVAEMPIDLPVEFKYHDKKPRRGISGGAFAPVAAL